MKNSILFILISCLLLLSKMSYAQNEKGQLVISAGVGYSPGFDGGINITGPSFPTELEGNFGSDTYGFGCTSIVPNIGLTADYGVGDQFSLGLAGSYQTELVNWSEDYYNYSGDNNTDRVTRTNMAARILLHLNKHKSSFDPYIGLRPGASYWIDNPQNNKIIYENNANNTVSAIPRPDFLASTNYFAFNLQVLYGMRIYAGKDNHMAFNLEFGIGQPFLAEFGLSFRIRTNKKTQDSPAVNYGGHITK